MYSTVQYSTKETKPAQHSQHYKMSQTRNFEHMWQYITVESGVYTKKSRTPSSRCPLSRRTGKNGISYSFASLYTINSFHSSIHFIHLFICGSTRLFSNSSTYLLSHFLYTVYIFSCSDYFRFIFKSFLYSGSGRTRGSYSTLPPRDAVSLYFQLRIRSVYSVCTAVAGGRGEGGIFPPPPPPECPIQCTRMDKWAYVGNWYCL